MSNLKKILIVLGILLIGVAIGRYTLPAKVVTKIETREVIKEVVKEVEKQSKEKKNNKIVLIVETTLPDGTKRKETKIIDKGILTIDLSKDTTTDRETEKETSNTTTVENSNNSNNFHLSVMAATDLNKMKYGLSASSRVLGPITAGFFGFTDASVGVSLGIMF